MNIENSKIGRLVLTLKYGEMLKIGDAEICVRQHNGNQIKIMVSAPKDVKILRSKVIDRDAKTESQDIKIGGI